MDSKNMIIDPENSHAKLRLPHFLKYDELEYARIIGAISHDLSNPVAVLKSNIQLLRNNNNNGNKLNEEVLSMCDESIEELAKFLENIRFVNSSIKHKIKPRYLLFEIKDILDEQFYNVENMDFKRISIQTNLEFKEFTSDLDFLRRILLNLLINALKFSGDEVVLRISSVRSNLEFLVHDFGIGIPENEIDMIFNPFFRASNIKNTPGMGLGLSIVKTLTDSLDGHILINSLINTGTIIQIVIPDGQTG